jgi:hypothetical protein
MTTAKVIGRADSGALGSIPLIQVPGRCPRLRNNGYNCFHGQADLHVPGLAEMLPDEGRCIRQGHVKLVYDDGNVFGTYASTVRGNDTYSFC